MKKYIIITILLVLLTSCNFKNEDENINKKNNSSNIKVNDEKETLKEEKIEKNDIEEKFSETGTTSEVEEPPIEIKLSGKIFEDCIMIFGNQPEDLFDCKLKEVVNNEKINCSDLKDIKEEQNCNEILLKINDYKKTLEIKNIYDKYVEPELF